jgi:type II secretory pathway predicted ATPase ExeA
MYDKFFGLTHRPFLTVSDPAFMFWTENHSMAFTMLRYGLMTRAPITVVTGEIGSGKTTLLRRLIQEMPEDLTVGLISNMQAGRGELLHWVMMALDQPLGDDGYVSLFKRFQDLVVDLYARGQRVVLMIDEAQNLSVERLEELRMLSNINADKDELLQLILVGQPQLRDLLSQPEMVQFAQRISADFHLEAMSENEAVGYIHHRLEIAGATWRIFTPDACRIIHAATRGVPRLVNILCDLSLVYAFASEAKVVDAPLVQEFLESARARGIYRQFSAPTAPSAPTELRPARWAQ